MFAPQHNTCLICMTIWKPTWRLSWIRPINGTSSPLALVGYRKNGCSKFSATRVQHGFRWLFTILYPTRAHGTIVKWIPVSSIHRFPWSSISTPAAIIRIIPHALICRTSDHVSKLYKVTGFEGKSPSRKKTDVRTLKNYRYFWPQLVGNSLFLGVVLCTSENMRQESEFLCPMIIIWIIIFSLRPCCGYFLLS